MRIINAESVAKCLPYSDLIEKLRVAFTQDTCAPERTNHTIKNTQDSAASLLLMWLSRGFGYFKGEPIKFKPTSGEGPPSWLLRDGGFEIKTTARANGELTRTVISGQGDPGYGATSKMLAELGLCLALDDHSKSSHRSGVLTPSTGLGHALVLRLSKARGGNFMQFKTIMQGVN